MLAGPVATLNWSLVLGDKSCLVWSYRPALAVRVKLLDAEKTVIHVIQSLEAALRDGLPLPKSRWAEKLCRSVESFRIAAKGVADEAQVQTRACHAQFNDIVADVIPSSSMGLIDAIGWLSQAFLAGKRVPA